jgi:hypothetical protein
MRRLLALSVVLAVAVAAPAQAAGPPVGKYECVIGSSSILFGTLAIKSGKRYAHRGTKGTFTVPSAKKLRFKGGDLGGMRGRWTKTSSGTFEIALRNPRDDFESIYCSQF